MTDEPNLVLSKNSADRHFESTSDSQINLSSGSMVEAQHPAEALGAPDRGGFRFGAVTGLDQPIVDPAMCRNSIVEFLT
jgi:hypothetical protein